MIHSKCIFPECDADTFFIEMILELRPEAPNHKHGKTKVLSALKSLDAEKALAIIDKDPGAKVKIDLRNYDFDLAEDDGEGFLKLYSHTSKNYKIIEINKEFEYWLSKKVIPEAGILSSDYGVPVNWNEINYLKDENIRTKKGVYQFFNALIKSNSLSIKKFTDWVITHTK